MLNDKMKIPAYHLLVFQLFFVFGGSNIFSPLTLTRDECKFISPLKVKNQEHSTDLAQRRYYNFCDLPNRIEFMPLKFRQQNKNNLYLIETSTNPISSVKCKHEFTPSWTKISEDEMKNEEIRDIDQYLWGFKIHTKNIFDWSASCSCTKLDSELNYKMDNQFLVISGFSLFHDNKNNRIVAAKYILSSNKPDYSSFTWELYLSLFKKAGPLNLSYFNFFSQSNRNVSVKLITPTKEQPNFPQKLILSELVPPNHLIYRDEAKIFENLIPLWKSLDFYPVEINKFIDKVAKKIGDLMITSGTTILENIEKVTYENQHGARKVVPELLWKTIEFKQEMKTYGVIIIINNSPFKITKKICESDVCDQRNWSFRGPITKHHIYCCDMTSDSIKNLKFQFLSYESRTEFNLNAEGYLIENLD